MTPYVDGFVLVLKKKNLKAYKKQATLSCKVWKEYGALDYYECLADDIDVPFGWPFSKVYKVKKDETLIFAYVLYKSKADRKRIMRKVEQDPRMDASAQKQTFDFKRFSAGSFKVIVRPKK